MLISNAAIRIPLSCEIYDKEWKFVASQVVIHQI